MHGDVIAKLLLWGSELSFVSPCCVFSLSASSVTLKDLGFEQVLGCYEYILKIV